MIVDSTTVKDLGTPIRSLQGYDKQGLILFPHPNYCGQAALFTLSDTNIIEPFPEVQQGVSALVVHKGTWALYDSPNFKGNRIVINGKDTFGPGTCISFGGYNKVQSVECL